MSGDIDGGISILLYGDSGTGKTPIGATTPAPRLILDQDSGGTRFIRPRPVVWDPIREYTPEPGDWETCIVHCTSWQTTTSAIDVLWSGEHPFKSVTLDSLTYAQDRLKEELISREGKLRMTEQLWGDALLEMQDHVRKLVDCTVHPTNPLQAVVITALATVNKRNRTSPAVQGGLLEKLPAMVDLAGYLIVDDEATGKEARRMVIEPSTNYTAKDRTTELPNGGVTGLFGPVLSGPIDVAAILEALYSEENGT